MSLLLRVLGWFLAVLAVAALVVWLNFDSVRYSAIMWMATPGKPFAEPPEFDYATPGGWAALPDKDATQPVDVFIVPGTTYFQPYKGYWNQSPEDAETIKFTAQMLARAGDAYSCCKIYVARSRQAILGAFADNTGNGEKALNLAYRDVERAFDYYIAHYNNGRPFVLAGASQGGKHIFNLLKNRISGTELKKRMVVAYPLIWWMKQEQFAKESPDIPICAEPTQIGCVATFNPVGPHLRTGLNALFDQTGIICVNPLTWRTDGAYADFELNLGVSPINAPDKPVLHAADAKCDENGRLVVSEIRANVYEGVPMPLQLIMNMFGRDNHHSLVFALFGANFRKNLEERVDAYLAQPKS